VVDVAAPTRAGALRPPLQGLVVGGVVATIAFRLGVLPGGSFGVDLLLGAAGGWVALHGRAAIASAWRVAWPLAFVVIGASIFWVYVTTSTALDATVRGQGLALLGGYGNWHQISRGPLEVLASRWDAPTQHLWAVAVLVQCVLVWSLLERWTARRADRGRRRLVDPSAPAVLLACAGMAGGVVAAAGGASGQSLLLATPTRGAAFFLVAGIASRPAWGASEVAAALVRPAVAAFAVVLAFGAPDGAIARFAGPTLVPVLAATLVLAASMPVGARERRGVWFAAVAAWAIATPSLAIAASLLEDAPAVAVAIIGSAIAAASTTLIALGRVAVPAPLRAGEWRRVVVPPLAVAMIVLLYSATGAYRWESPQPREQWEQRWAD
jgi:hypothetical protein